MDLPSEDALRFIVSRYAHLHAAHGEAIGEPDLVQPDGEYFPDDFAPDPKSVAKLFRRMLGYAPLSEDLAVALSFVDPEGEEEQGGGCGKSSCGGGGKIAARGGVSELQDGYRVEVVVSDVANPVVLTTSLARSIGALVLAEAGEAPPPGDGGVDAEIAAVFCGYGVLLTCGAAIYAKACGGLRMHKATHLTVEEVAVALALFCKLHDVKPSVARAHLETTQREAFDLAWAWADSNRTLLATLRDLPESLADGVFTLEPVKGALSRLFQKKEEPALPFGATRSRA